MSAYVCESCGRQGDTDTDTDDDLDRVLCPDCGEPVVPFSR